MREKRHSLIVLQVLLLVLGGVAFYVAPHYSVIRSLGAIACLVSVILIQKSKGKAPSVSSDTTFQRSAGTTYQRPDPKVNIPLGPLMWTLGAASLLLMGVAWFFLRNDAAHGYHQLWPVYFFGGAVLVCVIFLSSLVARLT
jgi:hypothetical protein